MQEEIEIQNCQCCRPIERDEAKHKTDIIATNCLWRESLEVEYALQNSPKIGETHFVVLHQPVKFSIGMEIWLFYMHPLAFYNGFENEYEIVASCFCFGKITNLVSQDNMGATIQFEVKKITTFDDIVKNHSLVQRDLGFLLQDCTDLNENGFYSKKLGNYYYLTVSVQSDLGEDYIVYKDETETCVCMINEWCFSQNWTFGGKFKLSETLEKICTTIEKQP